MKRKIRKPTKRQVRHFLLYVLTVIAGNAICAAGTAFFILPNGFSMGGVTGIGIFIQNLIPETNPIRDSAVSLTVYGLNIALFVVGGFLLGKKFAAATLAGTLLYPSFMSVYDLAENAYETAYGQPICGDSPILTACCGALLFGLGIAIVVRVGASTGGTDIPPLIFNRFFGWPVSVTMWALDMSIIVLQVCGKLAVSVPEAFHALLYGLLITILSSVVIDIVSPIGMKRTQVKIISKKYREIREMILNDLNRGVTVLFGQTGYLKEKCFVLLTIVGNRELVKLKNEVQKIDPEAFLTVSVVSEVRGRGFTSEGIKLPKEAEGKDDLTEFEPASPNPQTDAAKTGEANTDGHAEG